MCHSSRIGGYSAAFGLGLLVATVLPSKFLLFVLAVVLVILGLSSCKR